jgi:serine protease Do
LLRVLAVVLMLAGSGLSGLPREASASPQRRTAIVEAVAKARPAVVNIQGRKTVRAEDTEGGGDPSRQVNGMGTGIIFDSRGYILTNSHVVENVEVIQVTLADRRGFVAQPVACDAGSDLAIIKIDADESLPAVDPGVSSDLMPGETVIAVGNAFGYEHTVTSGIISALHREVQVSVSQKYHDLIQTDASINPGNSGGPLLNIDGQMIGINVAVRVGAQGIGFAIPVDEALEIAAGMMTVERIEGLRHGVTGETRAVGDERQFVVRGVRDGSPAATAGLEPGDVVSAVAQTPVYRRLDFELALLGQPAGRPIELRVARESQLRTMQLALTAMPPAANDLESLVWRSLGVRLTSVDTDEFDRLRTRYRGGMRVTEVRPDGPAAGQGIRSGDILVGMHVWETISPENVRYILNHADFQRFQPVKFYILRGKETLYGHLQVDKSDVLQVSRRSTPRL